MVLLKIAMKIDPQRLISQKANNDCYKNWLMLGIL